MNTSGPGSQTVRPTSQTELTGAIGSDRQRLYTLDRCLNELEQANQRGEGVVSPGLARRLSNHIMDVVPAMPIAAALDLVFVEQDKHLSEFRLRDGKVPFNRAHNDASCKADAKVATPSSHSNDRSIPMSLSVDEARTLTEQIKTGLYQVSDLMFKAHEGRAWALMGYRTWEAYVRTEFRLSRSRSYELVEQGRFAHAIKSVVGVVVIKDIPARLAVRLRPHFGELMSEIRAKVLDTDAPHEKEKAIGQVIAKYRGKLVRRHRPVLKPTSIAASHQASGQVDNLIGSLRDAVGFLANLPEPPGVLLRLSPNDLDQTQVDQAARWLSKFAKRFSVRSHAAQPVVRMESAPRG